MTVDATSGASSPSTNVADALGAASSTTSGADAMDKDTFLKLLVAQLKYQDPSNPVDSSQFIAQTAQFTQVEKMTDVANSMTDLVSSQASSSAAALVGRQVTWDTTDGAIASGVVEAATLGSSPTLKVKVDLGTVDVPLTSVKEVTTGASV
jgi:flagellar basal-body rod modification protein FlgD